MSRGDLSWTSLKTMILVPTDSGNSYQEGFPCRSIFGRACVRLDHADKISLPVSFLWMILLRVRRLVSRSPCL